MITINDDDLPITAAAKIINGTQPRDVKNEAPIFAAMLVGELSADVDMFNLEEIKEIADYLLVYYNAHKEEG